MKKISVLLMSVLALTLAFSSCKEDNFSLDATPKTLSFAAESAASQVVTVTAENVSWEAKKNDDAATWYRLKTNGSEVTVEVDNNPNTESRQAKFTITSSVESIPAVEITINQEAGEAKTGILLSPESLSFGYEAGEKEVTVTGAEWSAVVNDEPEWVTITPATGTDGKITVSVTANDTNEPRTATITVSNEVNNKTVSIEQSVAPSEVVLEPAELELTALGQTKTITVTGVDWSASASHDWVAIDPTSGTDGTITVTVTANDTNEPRTATITVTNAAGPKTVTISQKNFVGSPLLPDLGAIWYSYDGSTKEVGVASETEWTVESDQQWLTVSRNGNKFIATAPANEGEERHAMITLENGAGTFPIYVTQAGANGVEFLSGVGVKYPAGEYRDGLLFGPFQGTVYGHDTGLFTIELFSTADATDAKRLGGYAMATTIVAPLPAWEGREYLDIAPGTYTIDSDPVPFHCVGSSILQYQNQMFTALYPRSGTITIEGDHNEYDITFDFTFSDGTKYKGHYNGPLLYLRNDWEPPTPNVSIDAGTVSNAKMDFEFAGMEFPATRANMWYVDIYSPTVQRSGNGWSGDGYVLSSWMLSELDGGGAYLPDATYNIVLEGRNPNVCIQGGVYETGEFGGTWLHKVEGGRIVNSLAGISGWITTTRSGNTYTVTIRGWDDTGAYIDGTFTGSANITNR